MTEKEVVQALRCCAGGECKDCAMHEDKQRCQENLLDKAAEAIERLTAENAAMREKVPQWISVEERRPEPGKRVLATDGVFVGEAYRTSADTWRRYDGIAMRDCSQQDTEWSPEGQAGQGCDREDSGSGRGCAGWMSSRKKRSPHWNSSCSCWPRTADRLPERQKRATQSRS